MLRPLHELKFIEDNKDVVFNIFIFGKLRKNQPLHDLFLARPEVRYLGDYETGDNYVMYDMGDYPIISSIPSDKMYPVLGEIYEVDATTYLDVDKHLNIFEHLEIDIKKFGKAITFTSIIKLNTKEVPPNPDGLLEWRR